MDIDKIDVVSVAGFTKPAAKLMENDKYALIAYCGGVDEVVIELMPKSRLGISSSVSSSFLNMLKELKQLPEVKFLMKRCEVKHFEYVLAE